LQLIPEVFESRSGIIYNLSFITLTEAKPVSLRKGNKPNALNIFFGKIAKIQFHDCSLGQYNVAVEYINRGAEAPLLT
jgi:hypothetical protein